MNDFFYLLYVYNEVERNEVEHRHLFHFAKHLFGNAKDKLNFTEKSHIIYRSVCENCNKVYIRQQNVFFGIGNAEQVISML